jgi:hypothetical protein
MNVVFSGFAHQLAIFSHGVPLGDGYICWQQQTAGRCSSTRPAVSPSLKVSSVCSVRQTRLKTGHMLIPLCSIILLSVPSFSSFLNGALPKICEIDIFLCICYCVLCIDVLGSSGYGVQRRGIPL